MSDLEALKLAMETACAESEGRAAQITSKLADEPWEDVARFAAFCCQTDALRLKPWDIPPCMVADPDDPPDEDRAAARLLRQMLDLGIPRWHPDPVAAIDAKRVRS